MQGKVDICGVSTGTLRVLSPEETQSLLRSSRSGDAAARDLKSDFFPPDGAGCAAGAQGETVRLRRIRDRLRRNFCTGSRLEGEKKKSCGLL